jgi:hypothetical protein
MEGPVGSHSLLRAAFRLLDVYTGMTGSSLGCGSVNPGILVFGCDGRVILVNGYDGAAFLSAAGGIRGTGDKRLSTFPSASFGGQ